jgi:hypothetical protein
MDVDEGSSVEITTPRGVSVRPRPGLAVVAAGLDDSEVGTTGALPVTTPLRTCFDLAR